MEGLIIATVLIGWFVVMAGLLIYSIEKSKPVYGVLALIVLIAGLAWAIQALLDEDDKGPCLREETGMMYNTATKTMMPYKYCAERGEWVK